MVNVKLPHPKGFMSPLCMESIAKTESIRLDPGPFYVTSTFSFFFRTFHVSSDPISEVAYEFSGFAVGVPHLYLLFYHPCVEIELYFHLEWPA